MYEPTGYRYPFAPTRGMGQAGICPSAEQGAGIIDPNDPCQQIAASTITAAAGATSCYNVWTGTAVPCPVAGTTTTTTPAGTGPFGLPISFNWNWAVVAAVAAGLILIAASSGSSR